MSDGKRVPKVSYILRMIVGMKNAFVILHLNLLVLLQYNMALLKIIYFVIMYYYYPTKCVLLQYKAFLFLLQLNSPNTQATGDSSLLSASILSLGIATGRGSLNTINKAFLAK